MRCKNHFLLAQSCMSDQNMQILQIHSDKAVKAAGQGRVSHQKLLSLSLDVSRNKPGGAPGHQASYELFEIDAVSKFVARFFPLTCKD